MQRGPGTSQVTPTMLSPPRMPARTQTVRRQFDQRAQRFGKHDALAREIESRLFERLEPIRIAPQTIIDVGCGAGASRLAYEQRFPSAAWVGVDLSERMLAMRRGGRAGSRWLRRPPAHMVVADATRLPLREASADLIHSNLMLHWHPSPDAAFPEWLRVLRVGGLAIFSCLGPDTLRELRSAYAAVFSDLRPMPFVDMHDFGDMMVASGFENPVMDAERLTLTFVSPQALLAEVGALGGNPRDDRRATLPSSRQARRLLEILESQRDGTGRIAVTIEVAYGHAWKPARREPGVTAIGLDEVRTALSRSGRQR